LQFEKNDTQALVEFTISGLDRTKINGRDAVAINFDDPDAG